MPCQPKLRKKKVGNLVYWFTKAGGKTYFGNVDEVLFKEARRLFSDHVKKLLESDRASKGRSLTPGQLMDLFLEWI